MSCLGRRTRTCFEEDTRSRVGSCLIVCALPLLIPGVVMTAVAFHDEIAYTRYSAAHVIGMVLLVIAVLAFLGGIVLSIRIHSKVAPLSFQQTISTHTESRADSKLDIIFTAGSSKCALKVPEEPGSCRPNVNYFIEDNDSAPPDNTFTKGIHQLPDKHQKNNAKIPTTSLTLDSSSSSDDSYDSDDCSSGSYTITEDRFSLTQIVPQYHPHKQNPKLKSEQMLNFSKFRTTAAKSLGVSSNNFFRLSEDDIAAELSNLNESKEQHPLQSGEPSSSRHVIKEIENKPFQEKVDVHTSHTSSALESTSEIPTQENFPGTRERLLGLSSDEVSISSETAMSQDIVVIPTKVYPSQLTTSLQEDALVISNLSLNPPVLKESKTFKPNSTKAENSSWRLQLNHHKPLIRSPYATRPYSYPLEDRIRGLACSKVGKHSLGQKQSFRTTSPDGYHCPDKAMVPMRDISQSQPSLCVVSSITNDEDQTMVCL